jgi:predicted nucleic acid-binding protein
MDTTLVDSSVLLDIVTPGSDWLGWSSANLALAAERSQLVINPIIYAEVSSRYATIEELDAIFPSDLYRREALPYSAAFLAAKAFLNYRRRGGSRTAPIADFYIGAHAAVARYKILTRDPRRFRRYFPTVELISP